MITSWKMRRSFIKFSRLILQENVWRSVWRVCKWISGLERFSLSWILYPSNMQHMLRKDLTHSVHSLVSRVCQTRASETKALPAG